MKYELLSTDTHDDLITRLLKVRNVTDDMDIFLNPSYKDYRGDIAHLKDIDKAVQRILKAIENEEKIMIFGDYDVDGIMSSYIMYSSFRSFLGHKNISVRLPHRTKDGYGIKKKHIDEIHELGCTLIITVDNGITSCEEVAHANEKGIDVLITDHHKPLDKIPDAYAIVNPHLSPNCTFPEICGATVAFKVCLAVADEILERPKKKQMYDRMLPFVSIATIADCMPLIGENRLLVKKGFELINKKRNKIAPALRQFLEYLNIKEIDSFHVGFMISPRLNATGRMDHPQEGLDSLLINNPEKQRQQLEKIDSMNTERRKMQQDMLTQAQLLIDPSRPLLTAASDTFHEGIVGIVAGRLTEKYYKPSLILGINKETGIATGSLRGPDYFNIVDMLKTADDILLRYGGHAQAGGMSVEIEKLDEVLECFYTYCDTHMDNESIEKTIYVDTVLHGDELHNNIIKNVLQLGPYGQGNPEPLFLLEEVGIHRAEIIGSKERKHLKLHCKKNDNHFTIMKRGKAELIKDIDYEQLYNIIGTVKKDTYNGGFYIEGKRIV